MKSLLCHFPPTTFSHLFFCIKCLQISTSQLKLLQETRQTKKGERMLCLWVGVPHSLPCLLCILFLSWLSNGVCIWLEGSWEWNQRGKEFSSQLLAFNFSPCHFQLRQKTTVTVVCCKVAFFIPLVPKPGTIFFLGPWFQEKKDLWSAYGLLYNGTLMMTGTTTKRCVWQERRSGDTAWHI